MLFSKDQDLDDGDTTSNVDTNSAPTPELNTNNATLSSTIGSWVKQQAKVCLLSAWSSQLLFLFFLPCHWARRTELSKQNKKHILIPSVVSLGFPWYFQLITRNPERTTNEWSQVSNRICIKRTAKLGLLILTNFPEGWRGRLDVI